MDLVDSSFFVHQLKGDPFQRSSEFYNGGLKLADIGGPEVLKMCWKVHSFKWG